MKVERACEAVGVRPLRWGGHVVFAATMRLNRLFVRTQQHEVLDEKRAHGEVSDQWYDERATTMRASCHQ